MHTSTYKRKEGSHHLKAFEYYITLGKARTLEQVAQKFEVKRNTVERWSSNFQWKARIQKMNNIAAQESRAKLADEYFGPKQQKIHDMKLLAFMQLNKKIREEALSSTEILRAIKTVKIELGEPTSIVEGQEKTEEYVNPLKDLMQDYYANPNRYNGAAA